MSIVSFSRHHMCSAILHQSQYMKLEQKCRTAVVSVAHRKWNRLLTGPLVILCHGLHKKKNHLISRGRVHSPLGQGHKGFQTVQTPFCTYWRSKPALAGQTSCKKASLTTSIFPSTQCFWYSKCVNTASKGAQQSMEVIWTFHPNFMCHCNVVIYWYVLLHCKNNHCV